MSRDKSGARYVHAVMPDGSELVRYDHAGWWREWPGEERPRERLSVDFAASLAMQEGAEVFPGQHGAQAFLKRIRQNGRLVFTDRLPASARFVNVPLPSSRPGSQDQYLRLLGSDPSPPE